MIGMRNLVGERSNKYCCEDISLIENYEKAKNDTTQTYHCHHRLETHFSDGTPRPKDSQLSMDELIALDMYYNRPANELIFLTKAEHAYVHTNGRHHSEASKLKCSIAGRKGKGKRNVKGKHYYTNGVKTVLAFECPEGFHPRQTSEKVRKALSESHKGQKPWNKTI